MIPNFLKRIVQKITVKPQKSDFPKLAILLAIFLPLLIYWGPEWHVEHLGIPRGSENFAELANKYRATYAQIIGGVLFLLALYLGWQRLEVARQSQIIDREGQITERFTRAVDQLGNESLDIRLGGIYALERIARDSEKDHWTVMEILTAYIREHSPWRKEGDQEKPKPIPTDVQAVLTVIGRRKWIKSEIYNLDLHLTNLHYAILRSPHLERADLFGAQLEGAFLVKAHLEGAFLVKAHLEGANLRQANLEGTDFSEADLKGADLRFALGLTRKQIESAFIDQNTKLPDYLTKPTDKEQEEP